jgi:DNA-binding MarR family transcriptional regulator
LSDQGGSKDEAVQSYRLDDQVGFILRKVSQRHGSIFAELMVEGLTTTRFAVLAKLFERGPLAQNELGRQTAMDAATIKGVVDRLVLRDLVAVKPDPRDGRKRVVELSEKSRDMMDEIIPLGIGITERTLDPLDATEQAELLRLLGKIC